MTALFFQTVKLGRTLTWLALCLSVFQCLIKGSLGDLVWSAKDYKEKVKRLCPPIAEPLSAECVRPIFYANNPQVNLSVEAVLSDNGQQNKTLDNIIFSSNLEENLVPIFVTPGQEKKPEEVLGCIEDASCGYTLLSYRSCDSGNGTCLNGICVPKDKVDYEARGGLSMEQLLEGERDPDSVEEMTVLESIGPKSGCLKTGCHRQGTECMPLQCVQDVCTYIFMCAWIPGNLLAAGKPCKDGNLCHEDGICSENGVCMPNRKNECASAVRRPCLSYECNPRTGLCEFMKLKKDDLMCEGGVCEDGVCYPDTCGNGIVDPHEKCDWSSTYSGIHGMCCEKNCKPVPDRYELSDCFNYWSAGYHGDCVISWCTKGECRYAFWARGRICSSGRGVCNGYGGCDVENVPSGLSNRSVLALPDDGIYSN